ncbi:MAG TPA: cation:proton antiporter [Acidimicrobiales bacterium]|nr:cation:proton antiporter [Acidimicrobiales bacterium]
MSLPLDEPSLVFVVLFATALVAPIAAQRAGLPGIIGLIVAGLVLGPNALNVVERDGTVAVLGGVGLLYLVFQAALELDLDDFVRHRNQSLTLGAISFTLPFALGIVVHQAIGFSTMAAILLASCWASHTLLTYPALQRMGAVGNRAVATTVGATIVTDMSALTALALVVAAHQGALDATFVLTFLPSVAAVLFVILWVLPRVARWFFTGLGQDRTVRFLFVAVALFGSAGLAELAGIQAIVGAFLAGLALNRQIPNSGQLMSQISFFGASFLVPIFLISVGMLVDPAVAIADPASLGRAAAFTAVVVTGKGLAAVIAGRLFGYQSAEIGTVASLSIAQAAATLAVVFVGLQVGLIDEGTVNAVVLVILSSCLVASFAAARWGPLLPRPPIKESTIGQTVLAPVISPELSGTLMRIGALLARPDSGRVVPLTVLDLETGSDVVEDHRTRLIAESERMVLAAGADAQSVVRLDLTASAGILHAAVEQSATCLLMGWRGYTTRKESFFGERVDALLALSPVPVIVCRQGRDDDIARVVLSVTRRDLTPAGLPGLELAALVATRIAVGAGIPIVVVAQEETTLVPTLVNGSRDPQVVIDERHPREALPDTTGPGDLVVTGISPLRAGLGHNVPRLARALPDRTLLAVAPR